MKCNKNLVALCFFMVILCQIASARNIIARDMGTNKGDVPANIVILDSDSSVVAKNMTGISDSTAISLSDVEVIGHRKNIKLSGHNLLVDVEHDSILNHQNDIYELIGKVPGVLHVGNSFNVLGKGAPVYYLNGRKVRDQSLIDNLPVDQIKSLKIVAMPGADYDTSGSPVIDIKTKILGDGVAFNVIGNVTQAKHLAHKTGFSSTYNSGKIDLYGKYYYRRNNASESSDYDKQVLADTIWNKMQHIESLTHSGSHTYSAGMTYHLSDKSELGMLYSGMYTDGKVETRDTFSVVPNAGPAYYLFDKNKSKNNLLTHHVNMYYDASLNHAWHVSVVMDYISKASNTNSALKENHIGTSSEVSYMGHSKWNVLASNFHATHDFGKWGTLGMGYDFSYSEGIDKIDYERLKFDGRFENKEVKNAVFINYELPLGDFSLSTGIRYQNLYSRRKNEKASVIEAHSDNTFLPSLTLSYSHGMLVQNLSYSIGTERANYADMNDNVTYVNRYEQSKGNSQLKTAITHSLSYLLMYKSLFLTLNYDYVYRPLLPVIYSLEGNSAVTVSSQDNLSHRQALSAMLNWRKTYKCYTASLTGFFQKSIMHYPGIDGTTFHDGHPSTILNFDNDFKLPKHFLLSLSWQQVWGGYMESINVKSSSSVNLSIKKSFLNDRLRLSLDGYDIFNGDRNRACRQIYNVRSSFNTKYETRKVGLTLTYRFHKIKERENQTSAEVEMKRLGIPEE